MSLLYFHYKMTPKVGVHFALARSRITFGITGSMDWGFMWGGQYNGDTEKIETTSFLNDDLIFKATVSLAFNI